MRTEPALRTVSGRFNGSTGAVTAGTGFTVQRTGAGAYTVRFTPPFRMVQSINVTADGGLNVSACYTGGSPAPPDGFLIDNRNLAGTPNDAGQHFVATGR